MIIKSNDVSELHRETIERYQYLQTKEFKAVDKTRNMINKIMLKKGKPTHLIDLNDLTYSRLNKIYRKMYFIKSKIKRNK